ncbi:MAG: hypothetical protein K1X28_07390 [Parachlamydiales bacterium]|nr:hypothetical protein [Parachlamydiales bacterium]
MAIRAVSQSDVELLKAQRKKATVLPPQEAYEFALRLFDLFGQRFAKDAIRPKIKVQAQFDQVHHALVEIQTRLESGKTTYVDVSCPRTTVLLSGRESQNLFSIFQRLKEFSYALLPFPQKMILHYSEPELGELQRLEAGRKKGFALITEALKHEEHDDGKGADDEPIRQLSPEEEFSLARLYFRGGALVFNRVVYFSEMVHLWGSLANRNLSKVERLKKSLSVREWVDEAPAPILAFLSFGPGDHQETWSFPKYLVYCSVLSVQKNFGFDFPETVKAKLAEKFTDSENCRTDLCYFSATPRLLYELDIGPFERSSAFLVRAFQAFFWVTRNVDLAPEEHGALLIVFVYMENIWRPENFPNFANRKWVQPPWNQEYVDAFKESWKGLEDILSCIAKRKVKLSQLTKDDEALMACTQCWQLLRFLWHHPQRSFFIDLLIGLGKLPRFTMTLSTALEFCLCNQNKITPNIHQHLLEAYAATIQTLDGKEIVIEHTESLFFNPPHAFHQSVTYGFAIPRTNSFVEKMAPYNFPKDDKFCFMLREFILHPQARLFELLKDCEEIGIPVTHLLIYDVFSKRHPQFAPQHDPQPQTRAAAIALAKQIQQTYRLSEIQIFSIYMELLRLVMNEQVGCVDRVRASVQAMAQLCPAISAETVWFLFRYHPENLTVERVSTIADQRQAWVEDMDERQRFVVDQTMYQQNAQGIEEFANTASSACPDEITGSHFSLSCQMDLLAAFFPYLQPLSNFFHITNLTVANGIRWGEPVWKTHEGQLKQIKHSSVGVYLNWSVMKSRPVLFISFADLRTGRAVSSYVPLQVLNAVIDPIRGPFYGLLGTLAQQVLKEQAHGNVEEDAPETPQSWAPAYVGVKETIDSFPDVSEQLIRIWEFLRKVKLGYRNLYLTAITNSPVNVDPAMDLWRVAAAGNIFTSHPRGSLIPELPEEHPEHFTPDANEQFVEGCRQLFTQSTQKLELLNLDLKTASGNFPILYHTQTTEEFVGAAFGDRENEKAAPPEERTGRYITLSAEGIKIPLRYPSEAFQNEQLFRRYFDYHNLLLKSAYYFTRSLE